MIRRVARSAGTSPISRSNISPSTSGSRAVDERRLEGTAGLGRRAQSAEGGGAVGGGVGLDPPAGQRALHDRPVGVVAVDDEDAGAGEVVAQQVSFHAQPRLVGQR